MYYLPQIRASKKVNSPYMSNAEDFQIDLNAFTSVPNQKPNLFRRNQQNYMEIKKLSEQLQSIKNQSSQNGMEYNEVNPPSLRSISNGSDDSQMQQTPSGSPSKIHKIGCPPFKLLKEIKQQLYKQINPYHETRTFPQILSQQNLQRHQNSHPDLHKNKQLLKEKSQSMLHVQPPKLIDVPNLPAKVLDISSEPKPKINKFLKLLLPKVEEVKEEEVQNQKSSEKEVLEIINDEPQSATQILLQSPPSQQKEQLDPDVKLMKTCTIEQDRQINTFNYRTINQKEILILNQRRMSQIATKQSHLKKCYIENQRTRNPDQVYLEIQNLREVIDQIRQKSESLSFTNPLLTQTTSVKTKPGKQTTTIDMDELRVRTKLFIQKQQNAYKVA